MRAQIVRDSTTGKERHEGRPVARQHVVTDNSVWRHLATSASQTSDLPLLGGATADPVRRIGARLIQRKADEGAPLETQVPGLIVEDGGEFTAPGQMQKSEFLEQLRAEVCATAGDALSGSMWTVAECPWIAHWFGYYATQDALHVERALVRYVPIAAAVRSAAEYIPLVAERVRVAIIAWSATGKLPSDLPTLGSGPATAGGEESARDVATKPEGGRNAPSGPQGVVVNLGAGRQLDGGVRSRMEGVFGQDFSGVRVHAGDRASRAAANLHARAFTTGTDIAFNAGEYRPGTIEGDALLAHELAHVVQQRGASSGQTGLAAGDGSVSLEDDADNSAVAAMIGLWGRTNGLLSGSSSYSLPAMKSGLRLQRCPGPKPQAPSSNTLANALRGMLQQAGPLSVDPFLAVIHSASATDRRDTLNDSALRSGIQTGLGTDSATLVMSALLEGSQKWKNPQANDFYDFFIRKKKKGMMKPAATMNCWESIMYAAHLAGDLPVSWILSFDARVSTAPDPNAMAYSVLGFNTSLPQYPATTPKAGQLVFFKKPASSVPSHVLLSLGGDEGMSLWNQPNNSDFVQRIKITDLSSAGTAYIANTPW